MTHIQRSALLPYPASHLYELVNRVEHYPEFLPWCSGASILSETEHEMCARLEIAKAGVSQSFTTRNALVPGWVLHGPFPEYQTVDRAGGGCFRPPGKSRSGAR